MANYRIATIALVFVFSGCEYYQDDLGQEKLIPYPVHQKVPFEIQCKLFRAWSSDTIQIKSSIHTTFVLLEGVKNFDANRDLQIMARDNIGELLAGRELVVTVNQVDDLSQTTGQVECDGESVSLQIIRAGWGRYSGRSLENADQLKAAEEQARSEQLGLWAEIN